MRSQPTIIHLDLDAFFASVEQLDKPSLRGQPVIVGGLGPRGVVATASYEARQFGIGSGMSIEAARHMCPRGYFLIPRGKRYREVSAVVMETIDGLGGVVEQISIDEAYVDLAAGPGASRWVNAQAEQIDALLGDLRRRVHRKAHIHASCGAGTSKLIAKLAGEQAKPNGHLVVPPGQEAAFLAPLPARALWGVGKKTAAALDAMDVHTVCDLAALQPDYLTNIFGPSLGTRLFNMARGLDERAVEPPSARQSIGAEETFDQDMYAIGELYELLRMQAKECTRRLAGAHKSGRTINVKVKLRNFDVHTRSSTLKHPTADPGLIFETAKALLDKVDVTTGVRLLGVSVSSLSEAWQPELPIFGHEPVETAQDAEVDSKRAPTPHRLLPGQDVMHHWWGQGWLVRIEPNGQAVVRFERASVPGTDRILPLQDLELAV